MRDTQPPFRCDNCLCAEPPDDGLLPKGWREVRYLDRNNDVTAHFCDECSVRVGDVLHLVRRNERDGKR